MASAQAHASAAADRAYHLAGTWSCEDIDHATSRFTFTRTSNDGLALRNEYTNPSGIRGHFDERYQLGKKTHQWIWRSSNGHGLIEHGSASPWNSRSWTFEGVADAMGRTKARPALHHIHVGLRMIYTDLGDDAFQREFQSMQGRTRAWTSYSIGTCKRT